MRKYTEIAGYDGYWVDVLGNIYSQWTHGNSSRIDENEWHMLHPIVGHAGYCQTTLTRTSDGRRVTVRYHRIVLETFKGPCPPGMECRHRDGNPANNNLGNLAWGTPTENAADRERHGNTARGEKNGRSPLNPAIVRTMRKLFANGHTMRRLADRYKISVASVHHIVRRRRWAHIA